jgi:phosphatidylinositol glycan class A protein
VYYLHREPFFQQSTFPTFLGSMHMLRLICIREGIGIVHAHQAFSTLALEACVNAGTMGLKVTTGGEIV